MADEYVSLVTLTVAGQEITDFKKVKELKYSPRKTVKLMNKTGFMKLTPRYGVELDYVVPNSGTEFDFDSVSDAVIVIQYSSGTRKTYSGCYVVDIGEVTYDGDNEAVKPVIFGAQKKK